MRSLALGMSCILIGLGGGCMGPLDTASAPVVRGPLATRVLHPILLTQLALPPRRAAIQPKGSWAARADLSYLSIFERGSGAAGSVDLDGEQGRAAVLGRYGLGFGVDIEGELAVMHASSGFLDDFVDSFHEAFQLPDGGRSRAVDDQFGAVVENNGVTAFELEEDRLGFGDVPLIVNTQLRSEDADGPAVALRVGAELPLGSDERGFGNGGVDFGLGAIAEKSWERWSLFGGVNWIVPHEPGSFEDAGIQIRNRVEVQLGSELRWNARTSILLQLNWIGPITDGLNIEEIDREILDIGVGLAHDVGVTRWTVSFHEDAVAATGADFGVRIAADWSF